jgi:RNA polymerase-associated protein
VAGARRSVPVLYSDPEALASHRVRFVLEEKGIRYSCIDIPAGTRDEDLLGVNSSGSCPTLVDRELALYEAKVIIDYLDERYPHPPLMPMDPVSRARSRLALYRLQRDWESLLPIQATDVPADKSAERLRAALESSSEVFAMTPFFLSDEFSMLDAMLAPLLWRLPRYGIVLGELANPIGSYALRLFDRPAFQASLSDVERVMGKTGSAGE